MQKADKETLEFVTSKLEFS